MDIQTITMEPEQAQYKLDAYRAQLRHRADAEYEQAAKGYAALAAGKPLINLTEALVRGGIGPDKRPRLAVARADRVECEFIWAGNTATYHTANRWGQGWKMRAAHLRFNFERVVDGFSYQGYALVPMVPADVRTRDALNKCLILWEVEKWAERSSLVRPDRDPYLLRHIAGDLYAVLAQWDLTELERAVMAERVPA